MNWSQHKLAIKLQLVGWDVTRSTVAKIEARVIWVGDFQLFYFTRIFRVSLEDLFPVINQQDPRIHDIITNLMTIRM